MRILYFLNGSNFSYAGGMEYHLMDITNWFQKRGMETGCAIRKGTFIQKHLLQGRPNVYPLSWTGPVKVISFFQVIRAILDFKPDVISINRERDIKRLYYLTKLTSRFLEKKPKIVAIFQNVGCRISFKLEKLDGLIFLNEYTKQDYIADNQAAEKKSKVINYGIALPDISTAEKMNPNRARKFFKDVPFPLMGMVGEFRKNQAELIDVASYLKKRLPTFTIAFIGGGTSDQIRPLQEKIDAKGLTQNFIFTGNVPRQRMPDVFYDLDISVTTNRKEAFGLVFIESLAACTPLVAYNSGGPVEILARGGGVAVSGGPEEMADRLFALITNQNELKRLSMEARSVAEKFFSIEAMGKNHFDFYSNLLARE